jgi:hypothetical protein
MRGLIFSIGLARPGCAHLGLTRIISQKTKQKAGDYCQQTIKLRK